MNSEELEQSLRSEFETYLDTVLADLRQETNEFQSKIQAEFDRHRAEFDQAFAAIAAGFDAKPHLKNAFNDSISEHLKLARDEGAKIAANAMVEAEKFDDKSASVSTRYDAIRDAVNDISSKDSQSAILKTLVQHAGEFAPRGAFFIIKSGHFAGWKVFGTADEMEQAIRAIHFPVSHDTILGEAITSLTTAEGAGAHTQDNTFLEALSFGQPGQMMAFPLVARGRGVAVMYVDSGDGQGEINRDALETIVRVAGLTVELLASTQTAAEENRTMAAADFEDAKHDDDVSGSRGYSESYQSPVYDVPSAPTANEPAGFAFKESEPNEEYTYDRNRNYESSTTSFESQFQGSEIEPSTGAEPQFDTTFSGIQAEPLPSLEQEQDPAFSSFQQPSFQSDYRQDEQHTSEHAFRAEPIEDSSTGSAFEFQPSGGAVESPEYGQPAQDLITGSTPEFRQSDQYGQAPADLGQQTNEFSQPTNDHSVAAPEFGQSADEYRQPTPTLGYQAEDRRATSPFDAEPPSSASSYSSPFDTAVEQYQPATPSPEYTPAAPEPIVPAPVVSAPQARLSDRPVDLPIEVPEEERRLHNDARRFARLLVSEIKLYNEKKVIEGKQSHDLYDRLKEAIDRSREMYDKRVQPPVASKFDYFHYELLNSLAEGNVERLGSGYPGAKV